MRRISLLLAVASVLAGAAPAPASATPPIGHVWVVLLENKSYAESFGPDSKAPYFSRDLPAQGNLLTQYYGVTHLSLGNYVAMLSGQPSNVETQSDCQVFSDFRGAVGPDGVAIGQGCVYPKGVRTLPDQLEARGLTWKGYMQDMANDPAAPDTCRHPAVNAQDKTQSAKVGDQYAARHDPFVYFHSIIDDQARCDAHVVDQSVLDADLADSARTPSFSFITPNLCDDGHDEPTCVDGRPGGLVAADAYLQRTIPKILASPAFRKDGLLLVTFDEAEASGKGADSAACCGQPSGPNTPDPGGPTPGPGGGRIGAIALSRYIKPGTTSTVPYNHYSFLRSMQDLFGIGERLGYSNGMALTSFGDDVFTQPDGATKLPLAGMTPPASSPPVVPTCTTTTIGRTGRARQVKTGALIRSVIVSDPVGGRRTLRVGMSHGARLTATARGRTVLRGRRVRACKTYAFRLPKGIGPGRMTVTARLPSGFERRTPSFR